ncbi:hypothetical protein INS49_002111 [Diaporthe citri]|uniref:uncharacterized protein n=1 Tax=Diaporthe citri TaxID=83186 RepID=UPI001C8095E8|nr:uncharacterized protein INS49_002111 [Diaporthe citri]KAG6367911.1 hypothetical protein INS49_002111 [Diaporthe citri]
MAVSLESAAKVPASNPYCDLGDHGRTISTTSSDAQDWFNRGLVWAYAFNHREAAACFEQVIKHDPNCAIGHWGVAYALGPNYNKVWMAFDPKDLRRSVAKCYEYSQKATQLAHIDVLVGDYRRALHTNLRATIADDKYYAREGGENFYLLYRMHDYHSLIYGAMLAGNSRAALDSADRMEATVSESMLLMQSPPMASWPEFFKSVRVHILIRFGRWDELKKLLVPENKELYCVTVATVYYGRGIAYAATGDIQEADKQLVLFRAAVKRVPDSRLVFPNKASAILAVASAMLDGEVECRRGNYKVAFDSPRLAMAR